MSGRIACLAVLLLDLAACSYQATLTPHGGGEEAAGSYNRPAREMTVRLHGQTYYGEVLQGGSPGFGVSRSYGAGAVRAASQFRAVLEGPQDLLRCQFSLGMGSGEGLCTDSAGRTYDLRLE